MSNDLEILDDDQLFAVAGGKKVGNVYAGYPDNLSEGLAPSVVAELENIARQRMAEGDDRDSCADYIKTFKYNELCIMNEAEGFDYMMDFYYINMVIDRIYGISV